MKQQLTFNESPTVTKIRSLNDYFNLENKIMKNLLLIPCVILMTACEERKEIANIVESMVKGYTREIPSAILKPILGLNKTEKKIKELDQNVNDLEERQELFNQLLGLMEQRIIIIEGELSDQREVLTLLEKMMNSVKLDLVKVNTDNKGVKDTLNNIQAVLDDLIANPITIIDPCGKNSKGFDELLIVLTNGDILVSFTDSKGTFLTLLKDGTYQTTDGQNCIFSIIDGKYVGK
jgi:hypothetical protein